MLVSQRMLLAAGGSGNYWISLLGGAGSEEARSVAVDSLGEPVICGSTSSDGAGSSDVLIAKYDVRGDLRWARTLGGAGTDIGYGIAVDSSDNILISGAATVSGQIDFVAAKYNSSGVKQFEFIEDSSIAGYDIVVDSSDNITAVGRMTFTQGGGLWSYNSAGASIARSRITPASTFAFGATHNSSDNLIVCGRSFDDGVYVVFVYQFGTGGWQRSYEISGSLEQYNGVCVDSSDNVIAVGSTEVGAGPIYSILVTKFNSSGTVQWHKRIGGGTVSPTGSDIGEKVVADSSGNIYICGQTQSDGAGSLDMFLAKLDSSGNVLWQNTLGGTGSDYARGIALNADGDILLCGATESDGAGSSDAVLACLPPDGSGLGTYGSLTYQASNLGVETITPTEYTDFLGTGGGSTSESANTLTDAAAVLTEEKFLVQA